MNGRTNISEFESGVVRFAEKLGVSMRKTQQKVAIDLWTGITKRTPVDTGRARANWFLTSGSPSSDTVYLDAKGKNSVPYPPFPDVSGADGTLSLFITNNLPYIEALENGHSQQAPSGMVRLTMQEVRAQMNSV